MLIVIIVFILFFVLKLAVGTLKMSTLLTAKCGHCCRSFLIRLLFFIPGLILVSTDWTFRHTLLRRCCTKSCSLLWKKHTHLEWNNCHFLRFFSFPLPITRNPGRIWTPNQSACNLSYESASRWQHHTVQRC